MKTFVIALRATLVTLVLTGILYPLGMTALAQVLFPTAANGSLAKDESGKVIGSRLIGQTFANPAYFQPRPSAAGNGYDPMASGGSNFGPTSAKLQDRVKADIDASAQGEPRSRRRDPGRARHHVRQRTRSAHQSHRGSLAGPARGARTSRERRSYHGYAR